jgi:hypothetical protein
MSTSCVFVTRKLITVNKKIKIGIISAHELLYLIVINSRGQKKNMQCTVGWMDESLIYRMDEWMNVCI